MLTVPGTYVVRNGTPPHPPHPSKALGLSSRRSEAVGQGGRPDKEVVDEVTGGYGPERTGEDVGVHREVGRRPCPQFLGQVD